MNNQKIIETLSFLSDTFRTYEPLSAHTTCRVGGSARFYIEAKTSDELVLFSHKAKELSVPFLVLGSGANTLFSDNGFNGLVIRAMNNTLSIHDTRIKAGAGVSIGQLVTTAVRENLSGIECWAGIPGTVGGSVFGNMGIPYLERGSVADFISYVSVFRDSEVVLFTNDACEFGYRTSVFKNSHDIIVEAEFSLMKSNDMFSLRESMKAFQKKKLSTQPLNVPSSGCMFTNPIGSSVGLMVETLGLKGTRVGNAEISTRHGNFIVNKGGATAADVRTLMEMVKRAIKKEYNIELKEEVNLIGF